MHPIVRGTRSADTMCAPRPLALSLLLFLSTTHACVSDGSIGPGDVLSRSSFFVGTDTVPGGVVESEVAVGFQPSDAVSIETALAHGLSDRTELQARLLTYRYDRSGEPTLEGVGDLSILLAHRFLEEDESHPSLAIELGAAFPVRSDDDPLRSEGIDGGLSLVGSQWFADTYASTTLSLFASDGQGDAALDLAGQLQLGLARVLTPWTAVFFGMGAGYDDAVDETSSSLDLGFALALDAHAILDLGLSLSLSDGQTPTLQAAWTWAY